jgi:hypothetical protein
VNRRGPCAGEAYPRSGRAYTSRRTSRPGADSAEISFIVFDVKRLRQLEAENTRLKKLVAERDFEIEVMKKVVAKNGERAGLLG